MRRIGVLILMVVLITLAAGVAAGEDTSALMSGGRFSTVIQYFNGDAWLNWNEEGRVLYTIAFFTAIRNANIVLLGSDPDGIGRMYMKEVQMIIDWTTDYYKEYDTYHSIPLEKVLKQAYKNVRGQY